MPEHGGVSESDVVVLGGGPAGYSCALRLRDHGLSVALVEADAPGGTCLNRGCIPTRAMLQAASIADYLRGGSRWGIEAIVEKVDVARMHATRDDVVRRNVHAVERHLDGAGVDMRRGWGHLTGPRTVDVDGQVVTARRALVIATGSTQRTFERITPDGVSVLTTDDAFSYDRIPSSALILGGGAVGAEFSQLWNAFGCEVTILEREQRLVPMEDPFVGDTLARALRRRGIRSITGIHVEDVRSSEIGVEVDVTTGAGVQTLSAEVLLLAAGRAPATSGIGLEHAGVATENGYVRVDDSLATNVDGVYAFGDVLGPPSPGRANVAFAEGMAAADTIAGQRSLAIDYSQIPRVTHGIIETATVGLSEEAAAAAGLDPVSRTVPGGAVAMGLIAGEPGGAKVVVDGEGTVVGVHLVGPRAVELIGEAAGVTSFEASAAEAASVLHPHPSMAEQLQELYLAMAGTPLHLR